MSKCWICVLFLLCLIPLGFAGDIQVSCEPGLRVYLDDQFAGVTSEKDDGLFLMEISKGRHTVRIEKPGFSSQSFELEMLDLPMEIETAEFLPLLETDKSKHNKQEAETTKMDVALLAGELLVTSAPQNCVVKIDGHSQEKTTPQLSIGGIAAGSHTISFHKAGYEPVTGVVELQPGAVVSVRGNLKSGQIAVAHQGTGSLRVISQPARCTVRFMGKTYDKTRSRLNLSFIPAGDHAILLRWKRLDRSAKILIKNGQRAIVHVSFRNADDPITVSYEGE